MRIYQKIKYLTLILLLTVFGQGFGAALTCNTGTVWGGFTTQEVTPDEYGYYDIDSPEKLAWIACKTTHDSTNYKSAKVRLTQDIDLNSKLFIPISAGKGNPKFRGTIDGQGHTIRGLYIKGSEIVDENVNGSKNYAQNIGLVAVLSTGGVIKNLVLEVSDIYASNSAGDGGTVGVNNPISVGTLVGWMEDGEITNCIVEGNITTSGAKNRVGGLAGNVWSATISDCVSNVSISSSGNDTHVGGVVGALRNGGTVNLSSCVFEGDTLISTGGKVGGIVGYYEKSTVNTQDALYYTGNYPGVGKGTSVTTYKKDDLNSGDVVCALNKGTWDDETKTCSDETSDVWSEGQSGISMNGSDGYKITFDAKTGTFATGAKISKVVAKGAAITADEISIPTHADSAFAGWALTNDATAPSALDVANGNTTIYAVWKPIFNVTFSATPGVFPEGSVATKVVRVSQGDSVSIEGLNVPTTYVDTEDGNTTYYFTGWAWESKKFSEEYHINSEDTIHLASIKPDKDTTIYAVWIAAKTVTVTYKANEHGKTRVEFMRVEAGSAVPQPENPIAYEGYSFVKWCTETPCVNKFEFDEPISDNIILYADWASERYAINYELAGGTNNAANPPNYTIDTTDITLAAPTRNGYTFDGWFYNHSVSDGVETFENLATQITSGSTGEITVYAKWIPVTYTIEYLSGNTISATVRSVEKKHDVDFVLSDSLDAFTHIGCTQGGWSKVDYGKSGYKVDYEFGATYKANASLILFPYWTCNEYGVTYDVNGGSSNHGNPATYRGPAALTLKEATWNQHIFAGWYKEANFQNKIEAVQDIDQNITLYAKWERKITYKPGAALSGSGAKELSEQVQWNVTYKFKSSIDKYARENYTLDGWATADGGEIVYGLGEDNYEGISLTLYPHWKADEFTITYNLDGGTLPEGAPETYTVESAVELPTPTLSGSKFVGWLDSETQNVVTDLPQGSVGDRTLTAQWEESVGADENGVVTFYVYEDGTMTAEIDGDYAGQDEYALGTDVTVESVVLKRSFTAYVPATLTLPFDIDVDNVVNAKFYAFGGISVDENGKKAVEANRVKSGTLTANTPYMVIPTASEIRFKGGVIFRATVDPVATVGIWQFCGTYSYKTVASENVNSIYGISGSAQGTVSQGEFVKFKAGSWFVPMRAYLLNTEVSDKRLARAMFAAPKASDSKFEIIWNEEEAVVVDVPTIHVEQTEAETSVDVEEQTTHFYKTKVSSKIVNMGREYDLKGRHVNGGKKVKGAYYNKKVVK